MPGQSTIIADIRRPVGAAQPTHKTGGVRKAPTLPEQPSRVQAHSVTSKNITIKHTSGKKNTLPVKKQLPSSATLHARTTPSKVLKRQGVRSPEAPLKQKSRHQQLHALFTKRNLATSGAILLILGGIGIGLQGFIVNKQVKATTTKLANSSPDTTEKPSSPTTNSVLPSETAAPSVEKYTVSAALPRILSIEKFGIKARIVKLGIRANNQLAAPNNIYDTGWYDASSKPGEAGAMVIDGHVSGPTKHGVFYNLNKLVPGDKVSVQNGAGKTYTYKVIKKATYAADKVDMAAVLTPVTLGKPGLNLITCGGVIDRATNHYKDRTVVFTEQL